MFLKIRNQYAICLSFPRVRGDVPVHDRYTLQFEAFSPRARGCSYSKTNWTTSTAVFPACAGMFLNFLVILKNAQGFPRVRGDVPFDLGEAPIVRRFSPRARGCSHVLPPS